VPDLDWVPIPSGAACSNSACFWKCLRLTTRAYHRPKIVESQLEFSRTDGVRNAMADARPHPWKRTGFWVHCPELLPNRVMSELPVVRPQISGRGPLAAQLPRPAS
jgi:hypothetical protein